MERFTITFDKVLRSGKFLLSLMEEKKMPHVVNVRNIPYLIIPDAVKFFDYFKKSIQTPIENPESSIISIDNFNNYRIVPVQEARINIFTNGRHITVIDLLTAPYSDIMGSFSGDYIKGIEYHYNFLLDTLPFDLNDNSTQTTGKFVILWSNTLIKTSTLILTFIYTLFNLDERIKVTSNSDPSDVAVGYIKLLRDKVTTIADDFLEAIENLNFLSVLTNNGRR
jgi:hypothetical protein